MASNSFWKQHGFTIVLEFSSVFIGVLLALALNQWNQERIAINTSNAMIGKVLIELEQNRKLVQESYESIQLNLPKLELAYTELTQVSAEDDVEASDEQISVQYNMSLLNDSVWELALMRSSIDHLEIEQAQKLFRIYRGQGFIAKQHEKLSELMLSNTESRKEVIQLLRDYIVLFKQLEGVEQTLLILYDEVQEERGKS